MHEEPFISCKYPAWSSHALKFLWTRANITVGLSKHVTMLNFEPDCAYTCSNVVGNLPRSTMLYLVGRSYAALGPLFGPHSECV